MYEAITYEGITLLRLRKSSTAYLSPLWVQGALHQRSTAYEAITFFIKTEEEI